MYVLATDTVTLLQAGNSNVIRHIEECRGVEDVATTIVSRIEVLQGRFAYLLKADTTEQFLKAQRLLLKSHQQFDELPSVMLDEKPAMAADQKYQADW